MGGLEGFQRFPGKRVDRLNSDSGADMTKGILHPVPARWLTLGVALLLAGCSNAALLHPKGPVGASELVMIGIAFALMLIVVIPVIVMAMWFPHRYKASAQRAEYDPKWSDSLVIDAVVWLVPTVIVTALSILTWTESHRLDPFKPLESSAKPIDIDVVSLDWKWLFIYPEQNIATVNQLAFPAHVPVSFHITSDSVMSSFFIPQLGSQIYAMAGMQTRLNLLADEPGTYAGQNQQFSGEGFSEMSFKAQAMSDKQFEAWVQTIKQSPHRLDLAQFDELSVPGIDTPVTAYSWVQQDLFDDIIRKFRGDTGEAKAPLRVNGGVVSGRR
jgi:cytochrome o ubiquinol oxidase subunit II